MSKKGKWIASFVGRKNGAIGAFYNIKCECYGNNHEEAKMDLYNNYEHITQLTLKELYNKDFLN